MTFINGAYCNKCGAITTDFEPTCLNCFNKKYKFDMHRSCKIYDDISGTAVKAFKYSGKKYLADPIAKFMFAVHKDLFEKCYYLTFVPMTKTKLEIRGYNHMEEVAKLLEKFSGKQVICAFDKVKDTEDQASLNYENRQKNIKNCFVVKDETKQLIKGKNILIVDDVFTTGATSNECTKLLLKSGVCSVCVVTFLKTDPNSEFLPF